MHVNKIKVFNHINSFVMVVFHNRRLHISYFEKIEGGKEGDTFWSEWRLIFGSSLKIERARGTCPPRAIAEGDLMTSHVTRLKCKEIGRGNSGRSWGERGESDDDELAVPQRGQNVSVAGQNRDVLSGWRSKVNRVSDEHKCALPPMINRLIS